MKSEQSPNLNAYEVRYGEYNRIFSQIIRQSCNH